MELGPIGRTGASLGTEGAREKVGVTEEKMIHRDATEEALSVTAQGDASFRKRNPHDPWLCGEELKGTRDGGRDEIGSRPDRRD